MSTDTALTPELKYWNDKIRNWAKESGLDFFDTIFELVDYVDINQIASYTGFPTRYPHWRFGMEYEQLEKSYTWGLSKIYELVINNDPAYAYLMRGNELAAQKMVIAHVYAHVDFFKNNIWFSKTNRKMLDEMANHATRIRKYIDLYGFETVENFIDICLSIEDLIDPYLPFTNSGLSKTKLKQQDTEPISVTKFEAKGYMDKFINPPEVLEKERKLLEAEKHKTKIFPKNPEKDILLFLIRYAPLKSWQLDVLDIIRQEAYYFAPQRMTKIMNEGWASYWHSKLMTTKIANTSEIVDFADLHSGTMGSGGGLNPYKLGLEIYRDIEFRWDTGQHGKEWENCDNLQEKMNWDKKEMKGMRKIFEVRKIYNDMMFIDEFITEDFCKKNKLFVTERDEITGQNVISSRSHELIKQQLTFQLANFGLPYISIENANYKNRGELLLVHKYQGVDMRRDWAAECMKNIAILWGRPVVLLTKFEKKLFTLKHDGRMFTEEMVHS